MYINLIGIGTLTTGSSGVLLSSANYTEVLSVDFANEVTNAAAMFSFLSDLPPITLGLYLFVIKKAFTASAREALDAGYHSCLNEVQAPEIREKLYQWYILKLQDLGVDDFYRNPDPLSVTGAMHKELAHQLNQIDHAINKEVPIVKLAKECFAELRQASYQRKLATIATGSITLCVMALACFLILENYVLIAKTPVGDLFIGNKTAQNNEAFYLTQLGGVFSSVTAVAISVYMLFLVCVRTPYKKLRREKINTCFLKYRPIVMSTDMSNELYRIKELKLKRV